MGLVLMTRQELVNASLAAIAPRRRWNDEKRDGRKMDASAAALRERRQAELIC